MCKYDKGNYRKTDIRTNVSGREWESGCGRLFRVFLLLTILKHFCPSVDRTEKLLGRTFQAESVRYRLLAYIVRELPEDFQEKFVEHEHG